MKLKRLQLGMLLITTFISMSQFAYAQPVDTNKVNVDNLIYTFETTDTQDPTTTDYVASLPQGDPGAMLGNITYYALVVANILTFIAFMGSGIFMVISQGNDENLGKAKSMLNFTILAMAIAATALAIVTGITQLNFFSP